MIGGSIALVGEPRRVAALRAQARLPAVARGGVPAQQPRARRALLRRLLGHVLPAHLRGGHGRGGVGRAALVQPLHHAARADARAALGHRAADRVAARDAWRTCGGTSRCRSASGLGCAVAADRRRGDGLGHRAADVRLRRVRVGGGRAGAVARGRRAARDVARLGAGRAGLARAPQPRALRRLHRPRRDRGAVRRRGRIVGVPGPAARRAAAGPDRRGSATRDHLRQPTSRLVAADNGRLERIDLGAELRVRAAGARRGPPDLQVLLPEHGARPGPDLALLRG